MIRHLKIVLIILVGLQGLFYFISNLVNWDYAQIGVGVVLSQADSGFYQNLVAPAITSPLLVKLALIGIMTGELCVGLLCFKGAFDMYLAAGGPSDGFNASKTWAILGCGLALIVWFGIFQVFGAALYQMWQGEVGISSFEGAFMYHAASALILIFVNQKDD
jgi:predicted small integral membrane protein